MGTHSKAPSIISHPSTLAGQKLSDWLGDNRWALGHQEATASTSPYPDLPFLFKVLSINKALSIQAHPTRSHAQTLHKTTPHLYPDPNHKPELAVALTEFEGFCGFRPLEEIRGFVSSVPELEELVVGSCEQVGVPRVGGGVKEEEEKAWLRKVFTALMEKEEGVVRSKLERLVQRIHSGESGE